jgi:threonine synthase
MDRGRRVACYFCGKESDYDPFAALCPACREPLGFVYPARPRAIRHDHDLPLERFLDFLPLERVDRSLSLGEGATPLLRLARLGGPAGGPAVFAKNETSNPTQSFKDRGTAVVVQKARALGLELLGTVSTGNMAASTAAYGARAGLRTFVLVKEDTPPEKLKAAAVYGPELVRVEGDYGRLFERSLSLGPRHGIYFANSVDPVRVEGYKLTGYEIFEQLGGRPPRCLVVPLSSGGHLLGLMRAFLDLRGEGLTREMPLFVGVQAAGCSPLARAWAAGRPRFRRFPRPKTIAQAISNPAPPGGNVVLRLIRDNAGLILAVTDEEIRKAQRTLAEREGLFCLPGSATALAALERLPDFIALEPTDSVVLVLTGTGLKNLGAVEPGESGEGPIPLSGLDQALARLTSRGREA